jgi:hypothetical protein
MVAHVDASPGSPSWLRLARRAKLPAESGEALFFSTDPLRAAAFGKLHYVGVTAAEFSKFERPHSKRILEAERLMIDELHVQGAMARRLDANFGGCSTRLRAVHQLLARLVNRVCAVEDRGE